MGGGGVVDFRPVFYVEVNGFDIRRLGGKVGNPRGEAGE